MTKLERLTLQLRHELDKLQTSIDRVKKVTTAHRRIGEARQSTTNTELRKGRIGKRRRKAPKMR